MRFCGSPPVMGSCTCLIKGSSDGASRSSVSWTGEASQGAEGLTSL